MIYNALNCVVTQLNTFLKVRFRQTEDKAVLGSILNEEGAVPEGNRNRVLMTVVNLEHETARQNARVFRQGNNNTLDQFQEPYNFNLDVLVTSLFSDYDEALKFLSESVYFFQAHNVFDHTNTPDLSPNIQQLTFQVIKLSYGEAHNLWTALGAKYMPSVLFKMRMLSFQDSRGVVTYEVLHPEPEVTIDNPFPPNS